MKRTDEKFLNKQIHTPSASHPPLSRGDLFEAAGFKSPLERGRTACGGVCNKKLPNFLGNHQFKIFLFALLIFFFTLRCLPLPIFIDEIDFNGEATDIHLFNNFLWVIVDERYLVPLNISNPERPQIINQFSTGTEILDVCSTSSFLLIACGNYGIASLQTDQNGNCETVSELGNIGFVSTIAVAKNYVYFGVPYKEIGIAEIKEDGSLSWVGKKDLPVFFSELRVDNDELIASVGRDGLYSFSIQNPLSPEIIYNLATNGFSFRALKHLAHLYLADDIEGLRVFKLEDSKKPVGIKNFTGHSVFSISAKDNKIWAGGEEWRYYQWKNLGEIELSGYWGAKGGIRDSILVGDYLYSIQGQRGLFVFDIRSSETPLIQGSFYPSFAPDNLTSSEDILVAGDSEMGFEIFNISQPLSPKSTSWVRNVYVSDFTIKNKKLYVGDFLSGLRVFDIENPFLPIEESYYIGYSGNAVGVNVVDSYALIGSYSHGFKIVDISTTQSLPLLLKTEPTTVIARKAFLKDQYLIAIDEHLGLIVYDISDFSNPIEVYSEIFQRSLNAILDGDNLIIACGEMGVIFYDVKDPTSPSRIKRIPMINSYEVLKINDEILLVADGEGGLGFINIKDSYNPYFIFRQYPFQGCFVRSIAKSGDYIYISCGPGGVAISDFSTLLHKFSKSNLWVFFN